MREGASRVQFLGAFVLLVVFGLIAALRMRFVNSYVARYGGGLPPQELRRLLQTDPSSYMRVVLTSPAYRFRTMFRPIDDGAVEGHRRALLVVVLVKDKADAARSNFDAAHELGHLVLQHDAEPADVLREHEANAFASAFLMPAAAMLRELPQRVDFPALMALKRRWRVSLQALLYRARSLGRISESAYKRAMVRISAAGWRTREPGDLGEPTRPTVLSRAIELLEPARLLGLDELAAHVRITRELLDNLIPPLAQRPRVVVS